MSTSSDRKSITRPRKSGDFSSQKTEYPREQFENSKIVRYSKKQQDQKVKNFKYRINNTEFGVVMYICVAVDIVELVLSITGVGEGVNYILDFAKIVLIPFWLSMKGVSPMKPSRFLRLMLMWIIGLIPFLGSFVPEVAIGMWSTIKNSRKEDEENFKKIQSN